MTEPRTADGRAYPDQGHPWADFLHYRAVAIDWMHEAGSDDAHIAKILSMDEVQVFLIRTRKRA